MNLFKAISAKFKKRAYARHKSLAKDTKSTYSISEKKYSPKRAKLHERIISDMMKDIQLTNKRVAFFVGGGSATGKTTLRKTVVLDHQRQYGINFFVVDPDDIKPFIPEYILYKETCPKKAASYVHKESCDIRDRLVERLINNKIAFIYEGTLAKTKKYKNLLQRLKQEGYEIHLFISDAPLSLAKERAKKRAKYTGRDIPVDVIENTHKLVPKTFLSIKDLTDSYYIYDSRENFTLIVSRVMKDKCMYESFLRKSSGLK